MMPTVRMHADTAVAKATAILAVTVVLAGGHGDGRLRAQALNVDTGGLAFEVASVKVNKSGPGRVTLFLPPGDRVSAANVPLDALIAQAFQVRAEQLVGTPKWTATSRFDINAKAPMASATVPQLRAMLRALLIDRFKLAVHVDKKEIPIYALVVARADGKLGANLHQASVDCSAVAAGRASVPPLALVSGRNPCGLLPGMAFGRISGRGLNMDALAGMLDQNGGPQGAGRLVVNKTGLTGGFDVDLTWTPNELLPGVERPASVPPIDPNGPSIFTAVQEQLGLKLESQRSLVDVIVIDHVEMPSPN
jgi:uncharacterized protein (TIGR03435 family)